jgi:Domain of unknown function (DUF3427)
MIVEPLDWRAANLPRNDIDDPAAPFTGAGPVLWREYQRDAIPPHFGATFNPGNWNSGIVRLDRDLILLTTLKKGGLATGNHDEDRFLSPERMQWQSQTQTRRESQTGRMLSGRDPDARVHLSVRSGKLRGTKAAPFLYCGQPTFVSWEGEKPITVTWQLPAQVPIHLRPGFGIV